MAYIHGTCTCDTQTLSENECLWLLVAVHIIGMNIIRPLKQRSKRRRERERRERRRERREKWSESYILYENCYLDSVFLFPSLPPSVSSPGLFPSRPQMQLSQANLDPWCSFQGNSCIIITYNISVTVFVAIPRKSADESVAQDRSVSVIYILLIMHFHRLLYSLEDLRGPTERAIFDLVVFSRQPLHSLLVNVLL